MKYLFIGFVFSIVSILLSIILWGTEKAYLITGGVGLLFLVISMIMSGSLLSGREMRGNYATESDEDRQERHSISFRSGLIGFPNMIIAIVIYYLLNT